MYSSEQVERMADLVKGFRGKLLSCGFQHGNASGELTTRSQELWVRTSYSGGEFQIDVWRKPGGQGHHEGHERLRVHSSTRPVAIEMLADELCAWAPGADWPPAVIAGAAA